MITKVARWGNSQGVRLGRTILEHARIRVGDEVEIMVRDRTIVISPKRCTRGKINLADLISRIPDDYSPEETDWGPPVGREVW